MRSVWVSDVTVSVWVAAPVIDAGGEPVGNSAAADGDAPVRGSLGVDVDVRLVAQRLAAVPADLPPQVVTERLGDDHRAVHRQQGAALPGQLGGVALGGPQHVAGGDIAEHRAGSVRLDGGDRCRLVDLRPGALGRLREAGNQPGRLQPGAMRCVEGSACVRELDPAGDLVAVEIADVGLVQPPGPVGPERLLQALVLGRRERHAQAPALDQVCVDALGGAYRGDLVHGLLELPLHVQDAGPAVRAASVAVA